MRRRDLNPKASRRQSHRQSDALVMIAIPIMFLRQRLRVRKTRTGLGIALRTSSAIAALPASPWMRPTPNALSCDPLANRWVRFSTGRDGLRVVLAARTCACGCKCLRRRAHGMHVREQIVILFSKTQQTPEAEEDRAKSKTQVGRGPLHRKFHRHAKSSRNRKFEENYRAATRNTVSEWPSPHAIPIRVAALIRPSVLTIV